MSKRVTGRKNVPGVKTSRMGNITQAENEDTTTVERSQFRWKLATKTTELGENQEKAGREGRKETVKQRVKNIEYEFELSRAQRKREQNNGEWKDKNVPLLKTINVEE